jgi:hypothetical protein
MTSALTMYSPGNGHTQTRSVYRDWYDRMAAQALGHSKIEQAGVHMIEGAQVIRQGGESLLTGGLLGFLHVELKGGLDMQMGNSTVPVDGAMAVLGLGGAIAAATHPTGIATDMRNIGGTALGIFSFRKTLELLGEKKLATGGSIGGKLGPKTGAKVAGDIDEGIAASDIGAEDPIVSFARSMR